MALWAAQFVQFVTSDRMAPARFTVVHALFAASRMQTETHASAPGRWPPQRHKAPPRWLSAAWLLACALPAVAAQAEPSVPWTPSAAGRHAIELLVDDAGLALTTTH